MGSSSYLSGQQHIADLSEGLLGEHKTYFPLDRRQQFLQSWVVLQMSSDGLVYRDALTHQHHSHLWKGHTEWLPLPGAHIGCCLKIIQKLDDLKTEFLDHPVFPGHQGLPHRV